MGYKDLDFKFINTKSDQYSAVLNRQIGDKPLSDVVINFWRAAFVNATATHDVVDYTTATLFNRVAPMGPVQILSNNAGDTAVGIGVRSVLVEYLDLDYKPVLEQVTLAGVTPVNLLKSASRIQRIGAVEVGSNGGAVGTINVRTTPGNVVCAQISAGQTYSRDGIYTVPFGYTLMVSGMTIACRTAAGVGVVRWGPAGAPAGEGITIGLVANTVINVPLVKSFLSQTEIRVSCVPAATTTGVSGFIYGQLVAN